MAKKSDVAVAVDEVEAEAKVVLAGESDAEPAAEVPPENGIELHPDIRKTRSTVSTPKRILQCEPDAVIKIFFRIKFGCLQIVPQQCRKIVPDYYRICIGYHSRFRQKNHVSLCPISRSTAAQ
jgi:hypothetical protein